MQLLPIDIDESANRSFRKVPECRPILDVYPEYYAKVGYIRPWIGYFATMDDGEIVGACGFKGRPKGGKVEIAYGTFKAYEGRGIGTKLCSMLVGLALESDPAVKITARTLLDGKASAKILLRNGFECKGVVIDEEDGEVLEWEFKGSRDDLGFA